VTLPFGRLTRLDGARFLSSLAPRLAPLQDRWDRPICRVKGQAQPFALSHVMRARYLAVVWQPCGVQPGSASHSARSDDRCRYSVGSTRRSFGRPADSFERITSARSAITTSSSPTRRR
jgi:hypothetical protein